MYLQATEPHSVPEEHELPSCQGENDKADVLPSLKLSLKPEYEPMETQSEKPDNIVSASNDLKETGPELNELKPFVPAFYPAYMPIPYPFWAPKTASFEEVKAPETSSHKVLKPIPMLPKEPLNVEELVRMSRLSIGETERGHREPSPLSLKPSRLSAFHPNVQVRGSQVV